MLIDSTLRYPIFNSPKVVAWPTDPWGTPYVVYLLKTDNKHPYGYDFVKKATDRADFDVLFVSYGPDRVPGSYSSKARNPQEVGDKENQRLFNLSGSPDYEYVALNLQEGDDDYTPLRLQGYSEVKAGVNPGWIGVIDPNSNDIIIRSH